MNINEHKCRTQSFYLKCKLKQKCKVIKLKKFNFALEKLLSYKNQILEGELIILANLRKEEEDLIKQVRLLNEKYQNCKVDIESKMKECISPTECKLHFDFLQDLSRKIKIAKHQVEKKSEEIDFQIQKVKDVKIEAKSLEKLKESKLEEYVNIVSKKAEIEMDEFISATSY